MKENRIKVIGITKEMELHIHGNYKNEEWYTNLNITEILDILGEYTERIGDKKETDMIDHLAAYFYDKI